MRERERERVGESGKERAGEVERMRMRAAKEDKRRSERERAGERESGLESEQVRQREQARERRRVGE